MDSRIFVRMIRDKTLTTVPKLKTMHGRLECMENELYRSYIKWLRCLNLALTPCQARKINPMCVICINVSIIIYMKRGDMWDSNSMVSSHFNYLNFSIYIFTHICTN